MATKRRMPVNVLQGAPSEPERDPVLDGLVGRESQAPDPAASPAAAAPVPPAVPTAGGARPWGETRRLRRAREAVRGQALWASAVGLVPVPVVAGVLALALQAGLARSLAEAYGLPARRQVARGLAAGFVATVACLALAPVAAWALRALSLPSPVRTVASVALASAAATYLTGRALVQDAEAGGTLLGLDPSAMREFFRRVFAPPLSR